MIFDKNLILAALFFGIFTTSIKAEETFRYKYIRLDNLVQIPPGKTHAEFSGSDINEKRQIAGSIRYCCPQSDVVGIYENGQVKSLKSDGKLIVGGGRYINEKGTMGGSIALDNEDFKSQAAFFNKSPNKNNVELVTPQPNEYKAVMGGLNDNGLAIIYSSSLTPPSTLPFLYSNGKTTPINFGSLVPQYLGSLYLNNFGTIAGTTLLESSKQKAFLFDTLKKSSKLLQPLANESDSRAFGINNKGFVLGTSFIPDGLQRIGVWDRSGKFKTYFVQGTPKIPSVSDLLVFNDKNQIVVTAILSPEKEKSNSYLVPKPGFRLNIYNLVVNKKGVSPKDLSNILGINNKGDMIGFNILNGKFFMLQRLK